MRRTSGSHWEMSEETQRIRRITFTTESKRIIMGTVSGQRHATWLQWPLDKRGMTGRTHSDDAGNLCIPERDLSDYVLHYGDVIDY